MAAPTTRRTALQILAAISVATIPSAAKATSDGDVRLHALVDEILAINKAENALIDANRTSSTPMTFQDTGNMRTGTSRSSI